MEIEEQNVFMYDDTDRAFFDSLLNVVDEPTHRNISAKDIQQKVDEARYVVAHRPSDSETLAKCMSNTTDGIHPSSLKQYVDEQITLKAVEDFAEPIHFNPQDPSIFTIHGNASKELVRMNADGTMTFSEDYTPDEAAQVFWNAIQLAYPGRLPTVPADWTFVEVEEHPDAAYDRAMGVIE